MSQDLFTPLITGSIWFGQGQHRTEKVNQIQALHCQQQVPYRFRDLENSPNEEQLFLMKYGHVINSFNLWD